MNPTPADAPFALLLGTAQDGGIPQAGCRGECCLRARQNANSRRLVSSLAIVDAAFGERWIIDCTPDFPEQLARLDAAAPLVSVAEVARLPAVEQERRNSCESRYGENAPAPGLRGILLTHAHVGHYAGLIHLGPEAMAAKNVPVCVMPRMSAFLQENAPWEQLIGRGHVGLVPLPAGVPVALGTRISATPFLVPHRDEYSETVGYRIDGPHRSLLYLPDVDDWADMDPPIEQHVAGVDVAYLDGTFFDGNELSAPDTPQCPGHLGVRDMSEIAHPRIVESLRRFAAWPDEEREKVRFFHLNHTNRAADADSPAAKQVRATGCHVAEEGERTAL